MAQSMPLVSQGGGTRECFHQVYLASFFHEEREKKKRGKKKRGRSAPTITFVDGFNKRKKKGKGRGGVYP